MKQFYNNIKYLKTNRKLKFKDVKEISGKK